MRTTKTQQTVYSMMIENTGSHFLDSGGAYGRNWERNQKRTIEDFMSEPEVKYTLSYYGKDEDKKYYVERCVSVFHYLSGLTLDEICDEFNEINVGAGDWDWDGDAYGVSFHGGGYLDAVNAEIEYTFNTYNGESDLSQVLQGSRLKINDEYYYLIQVHNGCDVRGGYTDARLFKCSNYDGMIHEYIWDYMHESELHQELQYVDVVDDNGELVPTEKVAELLDIELELN